MFLVNIYTPIYFFSFALSFLIAYFFARNKNEQNKEIVGSLNTVFFISLIWQALESISSLIPPHHSIQIYLWKTILGLAAINSLFILRFIQKFTKEKLKTKKRIGLSIFYGVFFIANLFSDLFVIKSDSQLEFPPYQGGKLFFVPLLFTLIPLLVSLIKVVKERKNSKGINKKQLHLMALGLVSALLVGVLSSYILPLFKINSPKLGFLAAILCSIAFAQAIKVNPLFNIRVTIGQKIIMSLFILTLLPTLIRAIFTYYSTSRIITEVTSNQILKTLDNKKLDFENTLNNYNQVVLLISKDTILKEFNLDEQNQEINNFFVEQLKLNQDFVQIRLLNNQGWEKIRVDRINNQIIEVPAKELQYKGNRDYFLKSLDLKENETYISKINLNKEGNPAKISYPFLPVLRIVTPIINDSNERLGFLIVNFNVEKLISEPVKTVNQQIYYLTDQDGYFINNTENVENIWGSAENLNTGISFKNNKELWSEITNSTKIINLTDEYYYTNSYSYNSNSLKETVFFISKAAKTEILQPLTLFHNTLITTSLIVILLAITVGNLVAKIIFSPIEKLHLVMRSFTENKKINLEEIDINTSDEINDLKDSFVKLVAELQQSSSKVEQQVEKQTKEIEQNAYNLEKQRKAMLNLLEDINEERKISKQNAEELKKFKLVVDATIEQIIITDPDGIVLYANDATETISGFTVQQTVGRKAGLLWGHLMPKTWYQKFWHTIKTKKQSFRGVLENHRRTGEHYLVDFQVFPILDDQKEVKFFVSLSRDITREKEIDRMKTDFISLASHQLRTPLSAIKWFLEMLMDGDMGKLNQEQTETIKNIDTSNERMIKLVNSLLNISRIESGRITIEPTLMDFKKLISEVIAELKPNFEDKKQTINLQFDKTLTKIKLDGKIIRQVILNLLTNANKYTDQTGKIEVNVTKKDKYALVKITDNGFGIPEKDQDKIFKRFFRATNILSKETEGSGLGLYLAKIIIESSGGKIWFESEEGKGTTFWFTIPLTGMTKRKGEVSINE